MTAYTPVGINTAISFSGTSAPSVAIPQQTSYLRVTAHTNTCHVKVNNSDATPVANTEDFFVTTGVPEVINIGQSRSQPVQKLTKGSTTTIEFQQGTGTQFIVGDRVSLTGAGANNAFDFLHKEVTAVDTLANIGEPGAYSRIITVDYDSSAVGGTWNETLLGSELRASIKIAVIQGSGGGTLHAQQVQISGG